MEQRHLTLTDSWCKGSNVEHTWGVGTPQSQVSTTSAPEPRTCCSPRSCGSSWTCADTFGRLGRPRCVGRGNAGPEWERPAPDSSGATELLQAAQTSPPGSSDPATSRRRRFKAAGQLLHTGTTWTWWEGRKLNVSALKIQRQHRKMDSCLKGQLWHWSVLVDL